MKTIKLLAAALMLLVSAFTAVAQQSIKVSGTVRDASGPVVGAYIIVKGTTNGTATDAAGEYTISAPSNGTLVCSMMGYTEQEIKINGRARIDFVLEEDNTFLEETVVIGYGSGQKVSNLVGSVTTVKSESIKNAPSSSALDMLQGQVAGLAVLTTGGVAGDNNVSMTLHGVGSLSAGTEPLFVIDGIPSSSRTIQALNPNDIQSISVLKDASATSIYGSRAANGVVYVTTRAGSYNEKATVSYRGQYGISTLADFTMYDNMMSGDQLKDFWVRAGIYTYDYIKENYTDHGFTCNTRWENYFQQFNNPQYQNDLSIEGGGRRVAYMIGASQFHQRGNTIGNVYDRYTLRTNVQGHPKDWLKVGINMNFTYDTRSANGSWGDGSNAGGNNYLQGGLSMLLNPLYPAIDPVTGREFEKEYPLWAGCFNQNYYFENGHGVTDRYGLVGAAFVEIEPIKNLKITSRLGVDSYVSDYSAYRKPSFSALYSDYHSFRSRQVTLSYAATITNTIEYTAEINRDNRFSVLVGHEGINNAAKSFRATSYDLTDDRLLHLGEGTVLQSSNDWGSRATAEGLSESAFLSWLAHADYTLMDRYILDASFRYDSSSRFGPDNRWAPFWAVGALWKAKRENFLKHVDWLNDLNLKLSYGTQGNAAIGNYAYASTIGSLGKYNGDESLGLTWPSNYSLTWEQQGLFTATLNGRVFDFLDFDLEYYYRKTSNMLMSVPQSYVSGFSSRTDNVGGLVNTGLDITLGVDILRGRDYFLRANATFNYNKEMITELFNGLDQWEIDGTGITYVVGQPVSFYYPLWAGVDPEDGKQMWYLPTGYEEYLESGDLTKIDKTVTRMDKTTKEFDENLLNQNTGYLRNAPVNGGFGLAGAWKGLSAQVDFSYVLGKYLINNDAYFYNNPNQFPGYNASKAVSDYWTPNNKYAYYPDWSTGASMQFDSHLIEPASFLRLKTLLISYSLPEKWLGWSNGVLQNVKLTFTGRNLFTLTSYMGADPEVNSNLVLGLPGNTKQFLGGLEITF